MHQSNHADHTDRHSDPREHGSSKTTSKTPQVTIYSTHTCGFCRMEKAWLDEEAIEYTNHFVDEDHGKAHEMIEKSGQMGVPVTIVTKSDGSEELVVGFDRPRLTKLLGLAG